MSFDLGNIIGSINKAVLPTATEATVPDAGIEHEPVHAQIVRTPDSNPAAGNAERQGIIIIGGHPVDLHPSVAAAASSGEGLDKVAPRTFGVTLPLLPGGDDNPAPAGGFSGFLHTIANLGRG